MTKKTLFNAWCFARAMATAYKQYEYYFGDSASTEVYETYKSNCIVYSLLKKYDCNWSKLQPVLDAELSNDRTWRDAEWFCNYVQSLAGLYEQYGLFEDNAELNKLQ